MINIIPFIRLQPNFKAGVIFRANRTGFGIMRKLLVILNFPEFFKIYGHPRPGVNMLPA